MPLMAVVLDRHANLRHCNDFLLTLMNCSAADVLNRNWFELFIHGDTTPIRNAFAPVLEGQLPASRHDAELLTRNGERRLVNWNSALIRDTAGLAGGVACIGLDITERRRLECALLQNGVQEREQMARELHDGLAQDLFGVALHASRMATDADRGIAPTGDELSRLSLLASDTIGACRRIAHGLSPLSDIQGGLIEALRGMVSRLPRGGGPAVRYEVFEAAPIALPLETLDQVYRIAREAIDDALLHADAMEIFLKLNVLPDVVRLQVLDDGVGLSRRRRGGRGAGLKRIEYRAELLQASLDLLTVEPHGTRLTLEVRQRRATRHPRHGRRR